MNCPRCQATLLATRDPEAAGWCPHCGDIYQLVTPIEQARADRAEEAAPNGTRKRQRPAKHFEKPLDSYRGITADGCDESPHCLTCPLPECKYVTPTDRYEVEHERTEPMTEPKDELAQANPQLRVWSSADIGASCLQSLETLWRRAAALHKQLDALTPEAERLVKIAEASGVTIPAPYFTLAGRKAPKAKPKYSAWTCPTCAAIVDPPAGRSIAKHKATHE
ncbi:MAG: hypothetical protein AB7I04_18485 [Pseudomonadales bacterium]